MLKISFEMILDELEQEQPEPQFELGDDLLFTGVQLYERGVKNLSPDNPGAFPMRSRADAAYFLALPWLATALILASMVAGSPM